MIKAEWTRRSLRCFGRLSLPGVVRDGFLEACRMVRCLLTISVKPVSPRWLPGAHGMFVVAMGGVVGLVDGV